MGNENHIELLKKGADSWNQWRKNNSDIKPDLENEILKGASLRGADLRGADLSETDLSEADLSEADLRRANLKGANLKRANLKGADIRWANLKSADLDEANLPNPIISEKFDTKILNTFINFGMEETLKNCRKEIPHIELFQKFLDVHCDTIVEEYFKNKVEEISSGIINRTDMGRIKKTAGHLSRIVSNHMPESRELMESELLELRNSFQIIIDESYSARAITRTDLAHIEQVVYSMYNILYKPLEETIILSGPEKSNKSYQTITRIVEKLTDDDKCLLLYAALCHDIGKSIIRPRHGPEGADIIKDSGSDVREKFYKLGFRRSDFYFMSDLIRFHDYLAMIGTGEASYLIFAEVLYPVSNTSLSNPMCAKNFLNFLMLLNLADMIGSLGKNGGEDFTILLHDFESIKEIFEKIINTKNKNEGCEIGIHGTIPYKKYIDMRSELQTLSENHTHERLRRLIRSGFKDFSKQQDYKKWIDDEIRKDYKALRYEDSNNPNESWALRPSELWFSRNYDENINDIVPINSSLRGINVNLDFYTKLAYICKLDYFLVFMRGLVNEMILIEVKKESDFRKSPHDLRRDISMTIVGLVNNLVELYGEFTQNNTKIGLGFERFNAMYEKNKLLRRLSGIDGEFKEAEAYTKLRNMIVLWVITP